MARTALLITADDLGYASSRDAGILQAYSRGVVRRASLLVGGASAASAARLARAAGLHLGLHVNLTEGRPVLPTYRVPSLLGPCGQLLRGTEGLWAAAAAGELDALELRAEIEAQLDRFAELAGGAPHFADGHNHVHCLPAVAAVLAPALAARGVRFVRIPDQHWLPRSVLEGPAAGKASFYAAVAAGAMRCEPLFAAAGLARSADAFVGLGLVGPALCADSLADCLHAVPSDARSVELMTHPGLRVPPGEPAGCGSGPDAFAQSEDRELELAFLTSAAAREQLQGELKCVLERAEAEPELDAASESAACAPPPPPPPPLRLRARKPCVMILSSLTRATGNAVTARRFANILNGLGLRTLMVNAHQVASSQSLAALLEQNQCRLVLGVHGKHAGRWTSGLDAARVRTVMVIGGTDVNGLADASPPERAAICDAFLRCAAVVSFNEELRSSLIVALREHLAAQGPHSPPPPPQRALPPVTVIAQSFQPDFVLATAATVGATGLRKTLGLGPDALLLLLPAGIRPVKDPAFLFGAVREWDRRRVSAQGPDARVALVLVGPVLDASFAATLLPALRLVALDAAPGPLGPNPLCYCTPVAHATLLAMIREADAVVNSSISEGMSNALLEAMAIGTPVAARDIPGNSAVVQAGQTGVLFRTPDEFATLLGALLADHQRRAAMVAAARASLDSRFNMASEACAYHALLSPLLLWDSP
jgi:predicted glycoside hydrolase/deacetylase ChbG (UPF0249 family)